MIFRKTGASIALTRIAGALLALLSFTRGASAQVRIDEFPISHDPGDRAFLNTVIEGRDGDLYGTFEDEKPGSCGEIFRFSRATQTFTILHSLTGAEGCQPRRLVERADGVFYGTATNGDNLFGSVFSITTDGRFAVVYRSPLEDPLGGNSIDGLLLATDGNLYGTTGGSAIFGTPPTFFRVGPADDYQTLAVFDQSTSGLAHSGPSGPLVEAPDGSFYGTTYHGGAYDSGTIYRVTRTGVFSILHSFAPPGLIHPYGGLTKASDGNYYGATFGGGAGDTGGNFRMTPDGTVTILPVQSAVSGLIDGGDGSLYGIAYGGVVRTSFAGDVTVLAGYREISNLIKSADGHIWGASTWNQGTLFRLHTPESWIVIDTPSSGQIVSEPFLLSGWAIDQSVTDSTGIDFVHVWALPAGGGPPVFVGQTGYGTPRPDVGAYYGSQFTNVGFGLVVRNLPADTYTLIAYPHSPVWNAFDFRGVKSLVVTISTTETTHPAIVIDKPDAGATLTPSFHVTGWAIDMASASGTGIDAVHVWAFPNPGSSTPPVFVGVASYGLSRPDIAWSYGSNFKNSGYDLSTTTLTPGFYRLVIFARSSLSVVFSAVTRDVTIRPFGKTYMELDTPTPGLVVSKPFLFAGWAVDVDATTGSGVDAVHLWASPAGGGAPIFLGVASYGGMRPDVSRLFDPPFCQFNPYSLSCRFGRSAFGLRIDGLPPGQYQLVAFAHSSVTGRFDVARAVDVTVR